MGRHGTPVNSKMVMLSPLKRLTAGYAYRVEIKFTAGGNMFEAYLEVRAER